MKRLILIILAVVAAAGVASAQQSAKELVKQRKEITKMSRIERDEFVVKAAAKEVKAYEKAGWVIFEGQLPLEMQLERAFAMRCESDKSLFPRYVMGETIWSENSEFTESDAVEWAKLDMAEQIQTEICILIDKGLKNKQLTAGEAAAIAEVVMAGREAIAVSIGRVIPIVKCRRAKESGSGDEVYLRIAYGTEMAIEGVKKALRRELDKKALYEKFDNITKMQ